MLREAILHLQSQDWPKAAALFNLAFRTNPANQQAATKLYAELEQNVRSRLDLPDSVLLLPEGARISDFAPQAQVVALAFGSFSIQLYNYETDEVGPRVEGAASPIFSGDNNWLFARTAEGRVRVFRTGLVQLDEVEGPPADWVWPWHTCTRGTQVLVHQKPDGFRWWDAADGDWAGPAWKLPEFAGILVLLCYGFFLPH